MGGEGHFPLLLPCSASLKLKSETQHPVSLTNTPLNPQKNHHLLQMLVVHIPECHSQKTEPVETFIIELLTFTAFSKEKGVKK